MTVYSARREADLVMTSIVHVGTKRNFSGSPMPSGGNWTDFFRRATCFTRLQYLQWVLGLRVPSIPRSHLANLDGAFEYGAEREYASQFMCRK